MNKKTERKQNLALLIGTLRRYGPLTQAQLKEHCGVQASTISYLVNDLKKINLLIDLGQVEKNGRVGKPGNILALNGNAIQVLGIYVEDELLHVHRIGLDGKTYTSQVVPFDGNHVQEAVASAIEEQLRQNPTLQGIGLAIKAIVYNDGSIRSGLRHSPGGEKAWNFSGLPGALRQMFPQIPILVENDANCAAALYHYEHCMHNGTLVAYLLNKAPFGIGLGLVMPGGVYRGANGAAGEYYDQHANLRHLAERLRTEEDFVTQFIPAILPHIIQTSYLVDPECIVLSGTYFESLQPESLAALEATLQPLHVPARIASGEQRLNPAKGVALLATNNYVSNFVEAVARR
jgi:hypothetical protein